MTSDQQHLARDLIARVGRCVHLKERHGGYEVCMPGSRQIGHVRFNIGGRDKGRYSVYAYHPFSDPRGAGFRKYPTWRCQGTWSNRGVAWVAECRR